MRIFGSELQRFMMNALPVLPLNTTGLGKASLISMIGRLSQLQRPGSEPLKIKIQMDGRFSFFQIEGGRLFIQGRATLPEFFLIDDIG